MKLDMLKSLGSIKGLEELVQQTLELVHLTGRINTRCPNLRTARSAASRWAWPLASSPSLLLLDEPLAGMSPARTRGDREPASLHRARPHALIIDHDMDALFELAERITVLQEGRVLVEGTPAEIKGNAQVQEAYLGGVHEELA